MRVFFLTNIPAPYRVKFLNQLGKQCELSVVFEKGNESNREWEISGVGENFKAYFLPGFSLATQFHFNFGIKRHLRNYEYDVYVISGYASPTDMMAINYLSKHKKPFIFSADGGFAKEDTTSLKAQLRHDYISSADKYMSSGIKCDEYLIQSGAHEEDIYRYPFSTVTEKDLMEPPVLSLGRKQALLQRYGLHERFVISFGQFIPRKGFDLLLDMWGHVNVPDVSLLIVGGGPMKREYQQIIEERQLKNVVLVDFLQSAKLFELIRLSSLFVFPTRYDIWGAALGEAMACGLPVISSPNAAAAHELVIEGENGYMEDLNYPIRWARHMEELLLDSGKRVAFGRRSREIISHYTIENMVDSYMTALKDMVRQSG